MNLNLQFEISSDTDIVLDRKGVTPVILMESEATMEKNVTPLNLLRLKEFYPEAWETQQPQGQEVAEEAAKRKVAPSLMQKPYIPLPVLDSTLIAHIKAEFASQARLNDR